MLLVDRSRNKDDENELQQLETKAESHEQNAELQRATLKKNMKFRTDENRTAGGKAVASVKGDSRESHGAIFSGKERS